MISSRNYSPSAKLLPFIRRHYVMTAALPETFQHEDFLMADNAFIRVILAGEWDWFDDGGWVPFSGPLIFGANSKLQRIRVRGPVTISSFSIRPSAWTALFDHPATQMADRVAPLHNLWDDDVVDSLVHALRKARNDSASVAAMESAIEKQLDRIGKSQVDPVIATFESIARRDSTMKVEDGAKLLGLSPRQLERRCLASFGLSPKAVLQRSRFLDMASAMRGLSDADQAELAALRFFDQSHLNREFRRYTGMTPGAFQRADTPLFTESLKLRVDGKSLA